MVPFRHKSISEVQHWCWVIRPGLQSVFQFIPNVFSGVEFTALCRPIKFFHAKLRKPLPYGPGVVHWEMSCWNSERPHSNCLEAHCWSVILFCSIKISKPWKTASVQKYKKYLHRAFHIYIISQRVLTRFPLNLVLCCSTTIITGFKCIGS